MSSVNRNYTREESAHAAALREEQEAFCADVADGLHALAQPLTILRSAITLMAAAQADGGDCARYMDLSTVQIERACRLFSSVQDLLAAKLVEADAEPIDMRNLLTRVIEERSHALDGRGIDLAAEISTAPAMAFGDLRRTERALAAALDAAVSVSSAGDVIQVDSSVSNGFLECAFQSTSRQDNNLKSSDRLNLSLTKANMLSQQGRYEFTQEPFRISLALPVHASEVTESEAICCTACTD
jgi:signal transduction histidine kinase